MQGVQAVRRGYAVSKMEIETGLSAKGTEPGWFGSWVNWVRETDFGSGQN
jgi:hypothetical protein